MADFGPICPTIEYRELKRDPEHFVEILADIKGLQKNMFGKPNAEISLDMTKSSLVLCVGVNPLKGSSRKVANYRYEVKRLPAEIDPTRSGYKVENGKVVIKLRKAVPGSWAVQLSSVGLEHETEEEES